MCICYCPLRDPNWNKNIVLYCIVPVRVLHKDEKILGRKHNYLPYAQTAIYDSKVKLFLKQGISHQLGRDAVV